MRSLSVDFPADPRTWEIEDQFMFGPDILVAPVLAEGVRARPVYLPVGTSWRCAWTGEVSPGGTRVDADAPLERIPVFLRAGSTLRIRSGA